MLLRIRINIYTAKRINISPEKCVMCRLRWPIQVKQNKHIENTRRKHNTLTETKTLAENTIHSQKRIHMRRKRNTHTETKTLTENGKHNTLTENTIHSQKTQYTRRK